MCSHLCFQNVFYFCSKNFESICVHPHARRKFGRLPSLDIKQPQDIQTMKNTTTKRHLQEIRVERLPKTWVRNNSFRPPCGQVCQGRQAGGREGWLAGWLVWLVWLAGWLGEGEEFGFDIHILILIIIIVLFFNRRTKCEEIDRRLACSNSG